MEIFNLNNCDTNNLKEIKNISNCFIVCEDSLSDNNLLNMMATKEVREIHLIGKWNILWEDLIKKICDKNNFDKSVLVISEELANFINALSDSERNIPEQTVLFYDDENLKKFVLKRIKEENENKQKMPKRIELCCHTNMSKEKGISSVEDLINQGTMNGVGGLAITDTMSVNAYRDGQRALENSNSKFKLLYGCELDYGDEGFVHLLCKNNKAKRKLYEILTEFYINDSDKKYDILKQLIIKNRELFVVGSYSLNTKIINYALLKDKEKLINEIEKYDYIEVAPVKMYKLVSEATDEEIKEAISLIIKEAMNHDILIAASNNVFYASKGQLLAHKILETKDINKEELEKYYPDYYAINQDLISTDEMRYAFEWLNDDELIKDIVINNTHKIANMCEDFKAFDNELHLPNIPNAYEAIEKRVYAELQAKYGKNVDQLIVDRVHNELALIKENNYADIYYIVCGLCAIAKLEGDFYEAKGLIGSTLVGYLLGISECNPLPPHYVCPNCHKVVWYPTYVDGFDMPDKICECGYKMIQDGHNLNYQVLMGVDDNKMPNIDLYFTSDFCKNVLEHLKELVDKNQIINVGFNKKLSLRKVKKIVNGYAGEDEGLIDNNTKQGLINELNSVISKYTLINNNYIIAPKDNSINDYTPLMKIDEKLCTHNDYYSICNNFYKQNCFEDTNMYVYTILEINGIYIEDIDIHEQEIYELIQGNKEYGLVGIDEFQEKRIKNLIEHIRPNKFSDLVKVHSLAKGINVWENNQDKLFSEELTLKNVLASRDDVMDLLLEHDVNIKDAYEIMEYVCEGKASVKGFTIKQLEILKTHKVDDDFIVKCRPIQYMYSKAGSIVELINILRFVWLKIYKPIYFYGQWFAYKSSLNVINKTVEEINDELNNLKLNNQEKYQESICLIKEMQARGIEFINGGLSDGNRQLKFELNPQNNDEIIFFTSKIA